jgi:hypothetical protein
MTTCAECSKGIGTFAKNEDGSFGAEIIRIPDEIAGEYCKKCGTPKLEAYFNRLKGKADHKAEVLVKRRAAIAKAGQAKKAKRDERMRRATEICNGCGHTLAICLCPTQGDTNQPPPETRVPVGTLKGEAL